MTLPMKNFLTFLILLLLRFEGFAQTSPKILKAKSYSITRYFYKNISFIDTTGADIEIPENLASPNQKGGLWYRSAADAVFSASNLGIEAIPKNASVIINGIRFENSNILTQLADIKVLNIKNDSLISYKYSLDQKQFIESRQAKPPRAFVYQAHSNLPHDFLIFKQNTLEPVRYRCSAFSPILNTFLSEENLNKPSTRLMIDGRMQSQDIDYQHLDYSKYQNIMIFGAEDANKYFGWKARAGLITMNTIGSDFKLEWMLANMRVLGEIQDKNGNWSVVKDTIVNNIEQFNKLKNPIFAENGTVYMINGEHESEQMNRKTFDTDAIESIRIVAGNPSKMINDTVFINTQKERWTNQSRATLSKVMSDLNRIHNGNTVIIPIYILDNEEIDYEKLKQFKSKELEFISSLEGCDAINQYGKRAENGVVIYRRKKL